MESENLMPCPFCKGTKVAVKQDATTVCGHRNWYISHKMDPRKCPLVDSFGVYRSPAKFTTKEKAIRAWNGRAES